MTKASSKRAHRRQLEVSYGDRYYMHESERGVCFYCGDIATELDHCPPLAWVDLKTFDNWKKDNVSFLLVSSCSQCNQRLGDKPLFKLSERVEHIMKYLEDKYEKNSTLWSDDEIKEMSKDFQKTIKARQKAALFNLKRVRHSQWRLYHGQEMGDNAL